jgi:hypothetical protein
MPVIIDTSFEDYADGTSDLTPHGWDNGAHGGGVWADVVSSQAHTGSKSFYCQSVALQRTTGYLGRSVTLQMWVKSVTGEPLTDLRSLQVTSSLGTDGVNRWVVAAYQPPATQNLSISIFNVVLGTAVGVFSPDVYQKLRFQMRFSTVNAAGTDINADGCCRAYVDDVLVLSFSAIRVGVTSVQWATFQNEWTILYWDVDGYMDDVYADNNEVTCAGTANPPPSGTPCCGSEPPEVPPDGDPGTPPGTQPGPVDPPNPFEPLPPWVPSCAGGGTVPSAADETDSESWVH